MSPGRHDPGSDWEVLLHGYADGELDAANALRCEHHLAECPDCAADLDALRDLKRRLSQESVRWPAPERLRARVVAAIDRQSAPARSPRALEAGRHWRAILDWLGRYGLVPSLAVLVASVILVVTKPAPGPSLQDELVAGHVRSLLADHLTDVATSDQHTVKPWFNGRIDFSPPVADLAARGYPLVGGRVDYIAGRVVAGLVYRRNGHLINVFVWPSKDPSRSVSERDGYNLMGFGEAGLRFWVVSDLNTVELEEFRQDFAEAIPK